MKIYHSLDEFKPVTNAVVTQGTFDGVHLGHRKILERLVESARQVGGETVVITFFPHPRMVLYPDDPGVQLLTTLNEKITLLEEAGIDNLLVLPFTEAFSRMSSKQFVQDILVKVIGVKLLVIGYDHRFGKNREGSFEDLKAYAATLNFKVEEIPAEDIDHNTISSTKIRNALLQGDLYTANRYLGRPYTLTGTVVKGDQRGRTIGFPTANIQVEEVYKLVPHNGVYAVKVKVDGIWHPAMMNIGVRPTFNGQHITIEAHLLDFNQDLYEKQVTVAFIDKLRDEMRFDGLESLKKQLENDRFAARKILGD